MEFIMLFFVLLIASYHLRTGDGQLTLNVMDFKAKADNTTDYSQAFNEAWEALCKANGKDKTTLVIPENETFIVQSIKFSGPCTSKDLHIQMDMRKKATNIFSLKLDRYEIDYFVIMLTDGGLLYHKTFAILRMIDGKIEAHSPEEWLDYQHECWLCFTNLTDLFINGSGHIDAHGEAWWGSVAHHNRPKTLSFSGCKNIVYKGLTQMNSPKNHISLHNCTNTTLSNLRLIAPQDSPNTDGIDISLSNHIHILNSSIETGDDCIAINGGSYDINITRVACGPGHGISVGSLGRGGANETVENVNVRNCSFNGTQNGARIKTWDGGLGFARNILFENITLIDSKNPIIIDQHYCNGRHDCSPGKTAVEVSNVTYRYFAGTSAEEIAIKFDCDKKRGCRNIVMDHINITSSSPEKTLRAYCESAYVRPLFVSVRLDCPSDELGPAPPPYYLPPDYYF